MNKINRVQIKINTEFITLGQFLKFTDVIDSGFLAKSFILEHEILINREKENRRGRKLRVNDLIDIDNSMFFEITK